MTKLTFGKSVRRETGAMYAGRAVCVELGAQLVTFRLKGTKRKFTTTIVTLMEHAMRIEANRIMAAKKKAREERRKARKAGAL